MAAFQSSAAKTTKYASKIFAVRYSVELAILGGRGVDPEEDGGQVPPKFGVKAH